MYSNYNSITATYLGAENLNITIQYVVGSYKNSILNVLYL